MYKIIAAPLRPHISLLLLTQLTRTQFSHRVEMEFISNRNTILQKMNLFFIAKIE